MTLGESPLLIGDDMDVLRIPMNLSALDLARLSDIAVTLSTKILALPKIRRLVPKITMSLDIIDKGYLINVNIGSSKTIKRRIFSRLITALD